MVQLSNYNKCALSYEKMYLTINYDVLTYLAILHSW